MGCGDRAPKKEDIGPIDPDASTLNQTLYSGFRQSANAHDHSEEGTHLLALLRSRTVRVRDTKYDPENAAFDDVDYGGITNLRSALRRRPTRWSLQFSRFSRRALEGVGMT